MSETLNSSVRKYSSANESQQKLSEGCDYYRVTVNSGHRLAGSNVSDALYRLLPDQWRVLQQQRLDTQQGYHGDTIITQNAREKTLHNMYRDTTNQNRTASQRCTLRK